MSKRPECIFPFLPNCLLRQLESGSGSKRIPLPLHNISHDPRLLLLFRLAANIFEYLVHLLERLTSRFRDAEECKDKSKKTEDSEERIRAVAGVLNERRRDEALRLLSYP